MEMKTEQDSSRTRETFKLYKKTSSERYLTLCLCVFYAHVNITQVDPVEVTKKRAAHAPLSSVTF